MFNRIRGLKQYIKQVEEDNDVLRGVNIELNHQIKELNLTIDALKSKINLMNNKEIANERD